MENPRPEKVAVVDEVRERFSSADAALLTEYRGLDVAADGRRCGARCARPAASYKIYKNTLVRFAARDLGLEIEDLLTGPTAIAFVDGATPVTVAKALRDFARTNPSTWWSRAASSATAAVRRRRQGAGRRRSPRGAAGPAGRRHGGPDAAVRRPAPGAAPQLRLRPAGAHRAGWRSRRPRRRAEPPPPSRGRPAAEHPAEAADRRTDRRGRRRRAPDRRRAPAEADAAPTTAPPPRPTQPTRRPRGRCRGHPHGGKLIMATKEEILDSIASMTVLELSELLKDFEEKFGVTAAAPVAAVAAARRRWRRWRGRRRGAGRVRRRPHRRRRQEDPGHQGGACPHEPRPQGGQGPRRRRPQARAREGVEGRRREGQGASSKRPAPPSSSSSHRGSMPHLRRPGGHDRRSWPRRPSGPAPATVTVRVPA